MPTIDELRDQLAFLIQERQKQRRRLKEIEDQIKDIEDQIKELVRD